MPSILIDNHEIDSLAGLILGISRWYFPDLGIMGVLRTPIIPKSDGYPGKS